MDPTTMTLDEIRDWAARRQGWEWQGGCKWFNSRKSGIDATIYVHPIPPTLDAIAGLMPPNVRTFKSLPTRDGNLVFYDAVNSRHLIIETVPDTGDELLDRARLAMLATLAEDRNKEKAQ